MDGSHEALDVIVDAALAWRLLARGGAMIFDDYTWDGFGDSLHRPGPAVDASVELVGDHGETLFSGRQLAVRKRHTLFPDAV
ncbi:MAG: class I SAM-dependent methyltransferase [Thermoleophilia bacterium]|nr:class I SAM-dependent methyltransferase [Thermoleophilia bacterium]